jgi:hypothetical protein
MPDQPLRFNMGCLAAYGTAANVNDVTQGHALLHGEEQVVFADAGYQGASQRADATGVAWHVAMRPGKRTLLALRDRSTQLHENVFSCSQRGHTDMGLEVAQSAALADIVDLACAEFEDEYTATPASAEPLQPSEKPQNDPRQLALKV